MDEEKKFLNPIIQAQSEAEVPFVQDRELGHDMPPQREFLGQSDYVSLEEITEKLLRDPKKVVLNIGDSSTSGWDSDVVAVNRQRLELGKPILSAFFRYKTYSDFLREQLGDDFEVINAGIPAHSSLQGYKRLKKLIRHFEDHNIKINYVTAYYGNNDSVWNANREDKQWIGGSWGRYKRKTLDKQGIVTRASEVDYGKNMDSIVSYCREHNIDPILIEPPIPLYWKPGARVEGEDLHANKNQSGGHEAYDRLEHARDLWKLALQYGNSTPLETATLEEARELDYLVPRIKKNHLYQLKKVARLSSTPLVEISDQLDGSQGHDDGHLFIDYCHPNEKLNKPIANGIAAAIENYEMGKIGSLGKSNAFSFPRMLDAYCNLVGPIMIRDNNQIRRPGNQNDNREFIYTLF